MIKLLYDRLNPRESDRDNRGDKKGSIHINNMLLRRLWKTVLNCKGFGPSQKDDVVWWCNLDLAYAEELGNVPHAVEWHPLYLIGPKPGVPQDVLNVSLLPTQHLTMLI